MSIADPEAAPDSPAWMERRETMAALAYVATVRGITDGTATDYALAAPTLPDMRSALKRFLRCPPWGDAEPATLLVRTCEVQLDAYTPIDPTGQNPPPAPDWDGWLPAESRFMLAGGKL
jgi:hypothetical protein